MWSTTVVILLFVGSITSNTPEFTLSSNVSYLLPGAFATVTVNFQSSALGPFAGIISIPNNDVDTTVCVSALSVPAPVIDANPLSGVSVSAAACGATTSSSFYLLNTGGSDLNYSIAGTPAWVTTTPTGAGTLIAGDSVLITLDFNTGTMVGGAYTTNVLITSNDPQTPNFSVPCTLNVISILVLTIHLLQIHVPVFCWFHEHFHQYTNYLSLGFWWWWHFRCSESDSLFRSKWKLWCAVDCMQCFWLWYCFLRCTGNYHRTDCKCLLSSNAELLLWCWYRKCYSGSHQ